MSSTSDYTTASRIRMAALEVFGREGFSNSTVRAIAQQAGVSPGLVIHHFGSKEGLRQACDDWFFEFLRGETALMASGGSLPALQAYVAEHPELAPTVDYLSAILREGGPAATRLFDHMCALTEETFDEPTLGAHMKIPEDRRAAAAILVAYSMGVSMLGDHFAARLGGNRLLDPDIYTRYTLVATEIFTKGLFDDALAEQVLGPTAEPTSKDNS